MAENCRNFAAAQSSVFPFTQNPPQNGADVDGFLVNDLDDIVPVDESLMEKRSKSSFTRRASIIRSPTPSQKKVSDSEDRKSVSATKQRDLRVNTNEDSKFPCEEAEHIQNNGFELTLFNEQISNLERQLLEKEEALQSAEESLNQMRGDSALIREMSSKVAENDELLKTAISEFCNAKIMLAEKRATLERLDWETKMSSRKVEELPDECISMDLEMISLMKTIIEFADNISAAYQKLLPPIEDETDMMQMEDARVQYEAAISSMKSNPNDESIALAAQARKKLEALLF